MTTTGHPDPLEFAALLSALAGRALGRVRALAAETLSGDLEFAELELTFEGGPTLVLGIGHGGLAGARPGGPDGGQALWVAPGGMTYEADPSNPWQPVHLDAHPVWRPRLGSRVLMARVVRGGDGFAPGAQGVPPDGQPVTGVVFAFDDGRQIEVYDAGGCLHMVVLPEASAAAGGRPDPSR